MIVSQRKIPDDRSIMIDSYTHMCNVNYFLDVRGNIRCEMRMRTGVGLG